MTIEFANWVMRLIDAVIGLPENLFYGTSIPAAIIVFRKQKENTDVLFIDASKECKKVKAKNQLRKEDIDKIVETYKAYRSGNYDKAEKEKYSHIATLEEIKANDYNLNIPRYVDTFEEEPIIDLDQVNQEIENIKVELTEVDKQLAEYLKNLGLN